MRLQVWLAVAICAIGVYSQASAVAICNYNATQNQTNDLLAFVPSNSELISSARGFFEHFRYNRLIRTELTKENLVACASIVKVGLRDFGNNNTYGDYFVQVAYSQPGAKTPQFVLHALYRAGSVQSLEGTLAVRPWYMLPTAAVDSVTAVLTTSNFTASGAIADENFNPVEVVKNTHILETSHSGFVFEGDGPTYVPLYLKNTSDRFFLVTWSVILPAAKVHDQRGVLVKVDQSNHISYSELASVESELYKPLDDFLGAKPSPQEANPALTDDDLVKMIMGFSAY